MTQSENKYLKRHTAKYKNLSDKFYERSKDYSKQYCNIYRKRLEHTTQILKSKIEAKFKNEYPIIQLHKLSEATVDKCFVIGTLFKNQSLKPSILKQLAESSQIVAQPIAKHSTHESDMLLIEDEFQRYEIIGNLTGSQLVTGITCALLGKDDGNGKFEVCDYVFAACNKQIERPILTEDIYVVLLSGLDLVNLEKSSISLEMLKNWVAGLFNIDNDIKSTQITRIIIAGNSVRGTAEKTKPTISLTSRQPLSNDTVDAVKVLDQLLLELTQVIEVDLMPGEFDPSNQVLPQQPMHSCMFPKGRTYKSLSLTTNPYSCSVDGVVLMGTSGQPVQDILRYSEIGDALEAMESCLKWGHLAPTAPDTLSCFPFYDKDPFIIEECPHVYFSGNQEDFATKIVTGEDGHAIRLISIPEFASTHKICLLNLKNLECQSILFDY